MAVALYARVSTTRQAEKDLSIPDQLNQMRDWCQRNGYAVAVEYVEAGASATDDRRTEFQRMIQEAIVKPSPFEAVIVHSLSRFFRDFLEFALYERRLNKAGVRLISITQQTSDDPAGEMARRIFSMFDEYQSKENAKHTLRAMKENAKQGFFNGSRPPFGYQTEELDLPAAKGKKKRLVVNEAEARVVRRVFDLYLNGLNGRDMGCKEIASHFNQTGETLRGSKWSKNRVHALLCDTAYMGRYVFNKKNMRSLEVKPPEEWVVVPIQPIIDKQVFQAVEDKRQSRSPKVVAPRLLNSPTLLTGLLKCENCGAGMTTATGKGGRYRYYKCNTRLGKQNKGCCTPAVSMPKLDKLVLEAFANQVLSPERLRDMLKEMKGHLKAAGARQDDTIRALQRELTELETATNRLYEAVEKDLLPMDEMLRERAQKLKARREKVLIEIAGARRQSEIPLASLSPRQVDAFGAALRARLTDAASATAKTYLRHLVTEIRFDGKRVTMRGRKAELLSAAQNEMGTAWVPISSHTWLPDLDSNQGPAD